MVPLSEEQLAQISRESAHAARKAVRRYIRQARIGFLLLLFGIGAAVGIAKHDSDVARSVIVDSGRAVAVSGCNRDFKSITQLRGLFVTAEKELRHAYRTQETGQKISEQQFNRAVKFYRDQIEANPLPDCRDALTVITDDKDAPIRVPTPLHP